MHTFFFFSFSAEDLGLIPGSRRSPGEGIGYPFKYSCLENPIDWWAKVFGVAKGWTQLGTYAWLSLHVVFDSVSFQLLSPVWLFMIPWTAAGQASLSFTNSRSLPKLMPIESVMPSNHLILYCPLLLPPSIFPSIRVFSNESALRMRWPKYWSFSCNISLSNEHPGLIFFRMNWLDLLSVQGTLKMLFI